jgi:molecular chaperone DnaK
MVKDAEAHAEEDKRFRELVESRNRGDALVHASEKALKDLGDKVSAGDRHKVESAIAALKSVLNGDDKAAIDARAQELNQVSAAIAQQAYSQQAEQSAGASQAGGTEQAKPAGSKDGDVLDAEFEEVNKGKDRKAS